MKKVLITIGLVALTALSGCAVAPAYGSRTYYEPAPYHAPRHYYYGPPAVIVPPPHFVPRPRHHRRHR